MRNWTSDLRIPRSDALPLSHRDSTVSEVYYEVHIRRVLHTARISSVDSVMFGNRIREMESFDLGKEKEKDIFRLFTNWSLILNVPQKSNLTNLFPWLFARILILKLENNDYNTSITETSSTKRWHKDISDNKFGKSYLKLASDLRNCRIDHRTYVT